MAYRHVAVALVLCSAAAAAVAQRFECAPLSPSSNRTPAYAAVADPVRCEGFFERKVSQPFLEIVSLTAGQTLAWDAAPMLAATGLRLADLGFLGIVRVASASSSPTLLAPVWLSAAGAGQAVTTAVVRVSVAVSTVAWRSYRLGAQGGPVSDWVTLPASQLFAWQRVAVTIPLPADGRGLQIDVQAVGADDGQALPLLRFAIDGGRDAAP